MESISELIHTPDGQLVTNIPEDILEFLKECAVDAEEYGDDDMSWGYVESATEQAKAICAKYKIVHRLHTEWGEDGRGRDIYSDGTKGPWDG